MQPLDPHSLFSIFEQGDEQVYEENGVTDALKNPYVLMGMVLKGLENYNIMDIMYTRQYPEQYKNVKDTIKYKYYNKLLGYLQRIDSTKFETIYKIGESFDRGSVYLGLEDLKLFFEELEEYEKCAIIKRYQDLLSKEPKKAYNLVANLI